MPSWRLHWLVADLLSYGRDELVERLIDAGPLHDIGVSVVKEPTAPYTTEGGARRHRLAREAKNVLRRLASRPHLFYLHHALDDLFERVKSSKLLGVKLDPDSVLRGIRIDLYDIHLRIVDVVRIDFPSPPESLFKNLHERFDEVINILSSEAVEKLEKRLEWESRTKWSEFVHRVIERVAPRARRYFKRMSRIYHVEKAIDAAKDYLLGMTFFPRGRGGFEEEQILRLRSRVRRLAKKILYKHSYASNRAPSPSRYRTRATTETKANGETRGELGANGRTN